MHVLGQVGVGKRGGNAGVQMFVVGVEGMEDFHTQLIQYNNVVTTSLYIDTL